MKVSEDTEVSIPLRNLIGIGVALCLFVAQFFMITHRLSTLEADSAVHSAEITKARQFRYEWSRGELGLIGVDIEQNVRLDHIDNQLNRIREAGEQHAGRDDEHN